MTKKHGHSHHGGQHKPPDPRIKHHTNRTIFSRLFPIFAPSEYEVKNENKLDTHKTYHERGGWY